MDLTGTIPPHLDNLSFLVKLHFRNNSFHGTLPQELARLRGLQLINFGFNNFMGTIPVWFGSLSKLQAFNIFAIRRAPTTNYLRATNRFHESNLLGTGGFGSVYKGTISDGIDVAVKVFNLQIEGAFKSFDSESDVLSNIRHRNLIKIISCCSQPDFKALVLQYMPNGSLEKWLYSQNQNSPLNILQRLNIVTDVASALEYLHHDHGPNHVVHCDVKPGNILLDDDMVAHVADLGIARLLGEGDSMTQTMTLATIGYMAPEFGMEGIISTRGDVYSFGIVLMETFTRRKPTDEMFVGEMNLKQWIANSLLPDAAIIEVVDADLLGTEEDGDFVSRRDCLSSIMRLALTSKPATSC
ncbi:receptor kinase-like protein Xa21 [Prunus persica]|uniref:receptor kinase-like protein Xa21 n=1 Tax=Prunus persica TaxID=3760 RepID=UPI0009AB2FEC|nr:receptor kinase-like protein Xa21 [Prunus persica]